MNLSTTTRMAALTAAVAALSACGGGSAPSPAPSPAPAVGIYDVDYGQFSGVYTFLDDGRFSGVHFVDGAGLAGHPHAVIAAGNTADNPQAIAWANFIDDVQQVGAQESNGRFGRTFSSTGLQVRISGSMGSFSAHASAQKAWDDGSGKTLYGDPIALSVAAGTYAGVLRTVGLQQTEQAVAGLTIAASGEVAATVALCTYAGTLVQHGTTGVYDAQMQASGAGCGFASALAGVATPLAYNGGKPSWALQLDTADATQTAVFIVTKQ